MASSSEPTLQEILDGPALMAPPGQMYNFVNPSSIKYGGYIVGTVCIFVAIASVSIRMYTNKIILKSFNWEDGCLILGTAFFVVYYAVGLEVYFAGAGTHQWNIQVKNIGTLLHWLNTEDIIYNFSLPLSRIAIVLQYLRIFGGIDRKANFFNVGCWLTLACISIVYTIAIFGQIFACTPREAIWNPLIKGRCTNRNGWNIATAAFNVLIDIILVILPQREIWRLQISIKEKIAVSAVFLIALLACAACVVRLYYSIRILQTEDGSYYLALLGLYAATENAIGILCTCLPVFPRFFKTIGPKITSIHRSGTALTSIVPSRNGNAVPINTYGTWKTLSSTESQIQGTYETIEEGTELNPVGRIAGERSTTKLSGHVLRENQIVQTIEVESVSVPAGNVDLERQTRSEYRNFGW